MLKGVNLAIFALVLYGVALRKNRIWHPRIMITGFTCDLALLAAVEITRQAVEKSLTGVLSPLLIFHIVLSAGVMGILYPSLLWSGFRIWRGGEKGWHGPLALVFILSRAMIVVTSLSLARN